VIEPADALPAAESESTAAQAAISVIEVQLLLEAVYLTTRNDFRSHPLPLLRRRILERVRAEGLATISALQERVLHDPEALKRLVAAFAISPSTPFRDPEFFLALRQYVLPALRTHPFVRIWVCGCGRGEAVYALAVMLAEAGVLERSKLYATDANESALEVAREGRYALDFESVAADYRASGGLSSFEGFVRREGRDLVFDPKLRDNVLFAAHNAAVDASFNDFHLVVARDTVAAAAPPVQGRIYELLFASLLRGGYLALGRRESLRSSPRERCFVDVEPEQRIYRRVR
jgi:chemotaxis protein methyltransferase CheR